MKHVPTVAMLHRLLTCDPEAGVLTWKSRTPDLFAGSPTRSPEHSCANWNARHAGTVALNHLAINGYRAGSALKTALYAHRVIWAMATGAWPDAQIDHINGNRSDNRLVNLREATAAQNSKNVGSPRVGFIGVHIVPSTGKWAASVSHNRKHIHCGCFVTQEDAARARDAKVLELRGEFARLNFPRPREVT